MGGRGCQKKGRNEKESVSVTGLGAEEAARGEDLSPHRQTLSPPPWEVEKMPKNERRSPACEGPQNLPEGVVKEE